MENYTWNEAIWRSKALSPNSNDHEFARSKIAAIFVASIVQVYLRLLASMKNTDSFMGRKFVSEALLSSILDWINEWEWD